MAVAPELIPTGRDSGGTEFGLQVSLALDTPNIVLTCRVGADPLLEEKGPHKIGVYYRFFK